MIATRDKRRPQPTINVTLRLPPLLHEALNDYAKERDCSLNSACVDALWAGLPGAASYG